MVPAESGQAMAIPDWRDSELASGAAGFCRLVHDSPFFCRRRATRWEAQALLDAPRSNCRIDR
jgi:hypothetical protein